MRVDMFGACLFPTGTGLSTLAILDLRFVYCISTSCSVIMGLVQYTILKINSFKAPGTCAKHTSYQSFRT